MNKTSKIISILSLIIAFLVIGIIFLLNEKNSDISNSAGQQENNEVKRILGIYHTNNWYNKNYEANLYLNEDMTCKIAGYTDHECEWTLVDRKITFTLTNYQMKYINSGELVKQVSINMSKNDCESYKNINYKDKADKIVCSKWRETTAEATITNTGILFKEILFYKVG